MSGSSISECFRVRCLLDLPMTPAQNDSAYPLTAMIMGAVRGLADADLPAMAGFCAPKHEVSLSVADPIVHAPAASFVRRARACNSRAPVVPAQQAS